MKNWYSIALHLVTLIMLFVQMICAAIMSVYFYIIGFIDCGIFCSIAHITSLLAVIYMLREIKQMF